MRSLQEFQPTPDPGQTNSAFCEPADGEWMLAGIPTLIPVFRLLDASF